MFIEYHFIASIFFLLNANLLRPAVIILLNFLRKKIEISKEVFHIFLYLISNNSIIELIS